MSFTAVSMTSMASLDQYEEELDETLNTMESLSANCSSQAKQCCNRVINAYRIGQVKITLIELIPTVKVALPDFL